VEAEVTCTENFVKFGHVFFEIQARWSQYFTHLPRRPSKYCCYWSENWNYDSHQTKS